LAGACGSVHQRVSVAERACEGVRFGQWTPLVEFATSLEGRTPGQRHNATLAAKRIHGATLAPDTEWSFNQTIGQWVRSEGYVRAPVSYGGVLVPAWGGGVCQTSTTLYNAALLAGLEVLERHPHTIAPSYIAPGRDAAVAQGIADLKLRNPYRSRAVSSVSCAGTNSCVGFAWARRQNRSNRTRALARWRRRWSAVRPRPSWRTSASSPDARDCACACGASAPSNGETHRELCHETQYAPRCPAAKQHPHRV
jgi:vancomycin resistance protein YoaR